MTIKNEEEIIDKKINDEEWHNLIIRYKYNEEEIYLDNEKIYNKKVILNINDPVTYIGNDESTEKALNGYIEMIGYTSKWIGDRKNI